MAKLHASTIQHISETICNVLGLKLKTMHQELDEGSPLFDALSADGVRAFDLVKTRRGRARSMLGSHIGLPLREKFRFCIFTWKSYVQSTIFIHACSEATCCLQCNEIKSLNVNWALAADALSGTHAIIVPSIIKDGGHVCNLNCALMRQCRSENARCPLSGRTRATNELELKQLAEIAWKRAHLDGSAKHEHKFARFVASDVLEPACICGTKECISLTDITLSINKLPALFGCTVCGAVHRCFPEHDCEFSSQGKVTSYECPASGWIDFGAIEEEKREEKLFEWGREAALAWGLRNGARAQPARDHKCTDQCSVSNVRHKIIQIEKDNVSMKHICVQGLCETHALAWSYQEYFKEHVSPFERQSITDGLDIWFCEETGHVHICGIHCDATELTEPSSNEKSAKRRCPYSRIVEEVATSNVQIAIESAHETASGRFYLEGVRDHSQRWPAERIRMLCESNFATSCLDPLNTLQEILSIVLIPPIVKKQSGLFTDDLVERGGNCVLNHIRAMAVFKLIALLAISNERFIENIRHWYTIEDGIVQDGMRRAQISSGLSVINAAIAETDDGQKAMRPIYIITERKRMQLAEYAAHTTAKLWTLAISLCKQPVRVSSLDVALAGLSLIANGLIIKENHKEVVIMEPDVFWTSMGSRDTDAFISKKLSKYMPVQQISAGFIIRSLRSHIGEGKLSPEEFRLETVVVNSQSFSFIK